MAGIAGWIDWELDVTKAPTKVMAMGAALTHRGRAQSGLWLHRPAALTCRLGPLDAAGQPAATGEDGGAHVALVDGLLTNQAALSRELRAELSEIGRADIDAAALLLAAYRRWGDQLASHLAGAFAFAIWDGRRQRLLLGRDRLGVRPLFYAVRGRGLLFASEIKGLLAHPAVPPAVDTAGLAELLALSPNRTPGQGVFRHVEEVRPGEIVTWEPEGLRQRRYWSLTAQPHRETPGETVARVRELLAAAVTAYTAVTAGGGQSERAASAPAAMLSGGLDSTAVVALLRAAGAAGQQHDLLTFSLEHAGSETHFRPDAFQPDADGPWVARAVARYGTHHETVTIKPEQLASGLRAAMRARDLPGMADIDVALHFFCQQIGRTVPAVFSGEGADELFGGYPWFFRQPRPPGTDAPGEPTHFPWLTQLELRWQLLQPDVRRQCQPQAYVQERYAATLAAVPRLPGESAAEARQRELTFLNLTSWAPVLIERSDRMGQAAGVHVLLPFCDHQLVEYVYNVPWTLKAAGGQRKALLREAVADLLPPDLLQRPKSPFPKTHNPAYLATVRQALLDRLADRACRLPELINAAAVRELAQSPSELDIPWFGQLMRLPQLFAWLLQLDAWLDEYRVMLI